MINFPSTDELNELRSFNQPHCLMIYVAYSEPNGATNPNKIELKNLLRDAESALIKAGLDSKMALKTLKPARQLLDGNEFWPIHHESLLIFIHPKLFKTYHLPVTDDASMVSVGTGFDMSQLEQAMQGNSSYLILKLGHKNVGVYEGDRFSIKQVQITNLPTDMVKTLNIDEFPKSTETHTIAPASRAKGSEAYHGQYNVTETDKNMLLKFFRRIDKHLHKILGEKKLPLILTGVEYLLPIYRKVNTSAFLVPESIPHNVEHRNIDSIKEQAWAIAKQQSSAIK